MKFFITMNMPSRSGGSVHQIIGEHSAGSLEEFYNKNDGTMFSHGEIVLNTMHIGKVRGSDK
jgi:hypothetical protein